MFSWGLKLSLKVEFKFEIWLSWIVQVGIAVRSAQSGHLPSVPFSLVTLATTFVFLVGWRSALAAVTPSKVRFFLFLKFCLYLCCCFLVLQTSLLVFLVASKKARCCKLKSHMHCHTIASWFVCIDLVSIIATLPSLSKYMVMQYRPLLIVCDGPND